MFYTSGKVVDEQSGSSSPGILSALSTDGHRFLAEPGVRVHRCSASASIVLASGQTRLYCHTRDVFTQRSPGTDPSAYIVSFISDDGLLFSREPGVRVGTRPGGRMIGAAAPSLRPHPDGGLSMVFTTVIEPPFPWNLKALKDEASVIREIEEDLRGRAKMGSSAPQDGAE
jgi:hypothetical protein